MIYFSLYIVSVVIMSFKCCSKRKCVKKLDRKLQRKLYCNGVYVVVRESFQMVALCAFLSFFYQFSLGSKGLMTQNITAIVSFVFYICVPSIVFTTVLCKYHMLENTQFQARFGSSYADLNTNVGKRVLIQPIYFFLRRLYLSYLVMFGSTTFVYQMAQLMGSTLFAGVLPHVIHSIKDKGERQMTIINELLTLFSCYVFTTFNIVTVETNFQLGYFLIFTLGGYMAIIVASVIYASIRQICRNMRTRKLKKAYTKSRAQLQTELKRDHGKRKRRLKEIYGWEHIK